MASDVLVVAGGLGGVVSFGIGAAHRALTLWGQGQPVLDPVTGGAVAGGAASLLIACAPLLKSWFEHRERMKDWQGQVDDLKEQLREALAELADMRITVRAMAETIHIDRTWMLAAHIEHGTPLPDGFGQRVFDVGAAPPPTPPPHSQTTMTTAQFRPPATPDDDLGADLNRIDDGD